MGARLRTEGGDRSVLEAVVPAKASHRLSAQPHVALHAQAGPHAHVGPQQHSPAFACVFVEHAQPRVEQVLQLQFVVNAMVMVRVSFASEDGRPSEPLHLT